MTLTSSLWLLKKSNENSANKNDFGFTKNIKTTFIFDLEYDSSRV